MGFLITVEGGDYTGKTSVVVPGIKQVLEDAGFPVKVSREPGGTKKGEAIREEIFKKLREGAPNIELAKLFNIARKLHLDEIVNPFFEEHKNGIILLDRYCDSMFIYQGFLGGVPSDDLLELHEKYTNNRFPDLTLLLYFPENQFSSTFSKRRSFAEGQTSRSQTVWDTGTVEEHLHRQQLYLTLPAFFENHNIPRKFALINASLHPHEVIKESVEANQIFLQAEGFEGNLLNSFKRIRESGRWSEMDEIWQKQKGEGTLEKNNEKQL